MRYVYADNFRGFKDTFIPIQDVNFLVGENSTGKSSILGLLKLLASEQFWYRQEFNTDEVNFGHYDDIVSVNSKNQSYFRIGSVADVTIRDSKKGRSKRSYVVAYLLTFVEKQGTPILRDYSFNIGSAEVHVRIGKNGIEYKVGECLVSLDAKNFHKEMYRKWVRIHRAKSAGYQKLRRYPNLKEASNTFLIRSILEEELLKKKKIRLPQSRSMRFTYSPYQFIYRNMVWLAPIRTRPRKTYDEYKLEYSPEGEHTPFLIKRILDAKSEALKFRRFLKRIGNASGLFESVLIKKYGTSATAPFELDITLNSKALSISNVGYGVSQALPVIVELFARPKFTRFAIQQPEVHLHPKAQAALGDIIFELAQLEQKKFILETHSDYLIDRFRLNYRNNPSAAPNAQVLFFERTEFGNKVHEINIQKDGSMSTDQPKAYRRFFVNESLRLLSL